MPTVLDSINNALAEALAMDERVILLGEDILDPYGGAFKVTRGLSSEYPQRVITTPISEAGIVGIATGMAMRGLLPVVEIMFGDFLALLFDQVLNHAGKFRWMYNNQVRAPIVVRTPMGGRRGYGPTHSQTLEKYFLGVPGIKVYAPTAFGNPGSLLTGAIFDCDDPVLFIENKLLYLSQIQDKSSLEEFEYHQISEVFNNFPGKEKPLSNNTPGKGAHTYRISIKGAPTTHITIAVYGYMADIVSQAMVALAYEHEVFAEMIVPTQLSPVDVNAIINSTKLTGRLLVVEEGTYTLGWGAEIIARTVESLGANLKAAKRVAALDLPIPASRPLETSILPDLGKIVQYAKDMLNRDE